MARITTQSEYAAYYQGFRDAEEIYNPIIIACRYCIYWQGNNGGDPAPECKWRRDETPDPWNYCSEAVLMNEEYRMDGKEYGIRKGR